MKGWTKPAMYGLGAALLFFIAAGMTTAVIVNPVFDRMSPVTTLDWAFLILTSLLGGVFVALHTHHASTRKVCTASAMGGVFGGILGFGCATCNAIIVGILGVGGALAFVEPYRPLIGLVGIGLLSYAVAAKAVQLRKEAGVHG